MKSGKNIELDIYTMVKNSALGAAIKGRVYRHGFRPIDSKSEDVVVSFLAGLANQIQDGVVVVNVYVPDIAYNGYSTKLEDTRRVTQIEGIIEDCFHECHADGYYLTLDSMPTSIDVEGMEQHFVYARVKYQRLST